MLSSLLANALGLKRKDFVIAWVVFLVLIYLVLLYVDVLSYLYYLIVPIWAFTIFAYFREKAKVTDVVDTFEDDNLFYRYGTKVSGEIYPLRFDRRISEAEAEPLLEEVKRNLTDAMREEIDYRIFRGDHKTEVVEISDRRYRSDLRRFMRFAYTGQRGGELNHFLLFEFIGSYLVIHIDSFVKGIPHWYDLAYFLLSSPYKIWLWIIPWFRNDYSILTKVSKYLDNSFETYDLNSYYMASRFSFLDSIKEYLQEKGLLTEELQNIINYQMVMNQNVVNGNQVSVNGSNNMLGAITQKLK